MTPLPSLPTDNLYKFMALSGLAVLFGAATFWLAFTIAAHQRQTDAWNALFRWAPPYEYYAPPPPPADPAAAQAQEQRLTKLREEVEHRKEEFRRADAALWIDNRFGTVVDVLSVVFATLGLVSTLLGFRWWYVRLQRPLDARLAKEARNASA
jgi:hypothetical protein